MWYIYVFWTALAASSVFALWFGGAPERIALAIIAIGSVASVFVVRNQFRQVEAGLLAVDLLDQIALVWLMLKADRFWPIPLAAIHLLELLIPLAKGVTPSVNPGVYARTEQGIAYLVLLLIVIGAWRHRSRVRRFGADPSWSTYSAP